MKLTGKIVETGFEKFTRKPELHQGRRPPRIWIVVADKGIARVFSKVEGSLESIAEAVPDASVGSGVNNKTIGRTASAGGGFAHHKLEPHTEEGRLESAHFARDIINWLGKAEEVSAFDKLVLIAAPRMLGDLRKNMNKQLQRHILAEIDKDLTKLSERDLKSALDEIVWL